MEQEWERDEERRRERELYRREKLARQREREREEQKRKKRRFRRRMRAFIKVLAVLLAVGVLGGGFLAWRIYRTSGWRPGSLLSGMSGGAGAGETDKYVTDILVVVQNSSLHSGYTYGDMILLISFDALSQQLTGVSFLSGLLAGASSAVEDSLGAIYQNGGPEKLMQTMNDSMGMGLQNYACIDTYTLAAMIDLLGGVKAQLTEAEAQYIGEALGVEKLAGETVLSGQECMAYALDQRSGGSAGSAQHRLALIESAVFNMRSTATKEAMLPVFSLVISSIQTNLDVETLRNFAYEILKAEEMEYAKSILPAEGQYSELDSGLVQADLAACGEELRKQLYGTE